MAIHAPIRNALTFGIAFTANAGILALSSGSALAQVPTSVDPGRVEQRFSPAIPVAPQRSAPAASPSVPAPSAPAPAIAPFTLQSVRIQGNTAYSTEKLAEAATPYQGKTIGAAEAQAIARTITDRYRADGYVLSQAVVDGQSGGELRIRVIEGFIANVVVEGEVRQSDQRHIIEDIAEKIKAARPFKLSTLERYLLLLDDLPGATARGVLRPSSNTYGAADLVINMTHKLFEGSATVNNRGSEYIGPMQYGLTLGANSLLKVYDRTLIRYITASPMDELQFAAIEHEQQLDSEGTKLNLTGSYTETEPSIRPLIPDIDGRSYFFQARVSSPIVRSRKENLTVRGAFDYRNSKTDFFGVQLSQDRIPTLRAGATYDFTDRFDGVVLMDGQVSRGLPIMNATEENDGGSRTDAEDNFTKFNLDISRVQDITRGVSLFTAASGQYALDRLLPSEQFSVGGENFGSGYDPAEISGDHGIAARAELRFSQALERQYFSSYQIYTFYDIGRVWTKDTTDGQDSLASAGLGARANFTPWLSGTAELGVPLTRDVAAEGDDDPRVFFNATARF